MFCQNLHHICPTLLLSKKFPDRYIVLGASKPLEEVSSKVFEEIIKKLGR